MNLLINGGSSDIGRALLEHAHKSSIANITSISRSFIKIEDRIPGINYLSGYNFLRSADIGEIAKFALKHFVGPFTVIHCSGDFWNHKPLDQTDPTIARSHIESHYLTLYNVVYALIPVMQQVGGGRFIAFSCNSVRHNYPEMAPFTSAKAAVETLIKCVANEYSSIGIQSNAVALPTIATKKVLENKIIDDREKYVSPAELASFVIDEVANSSIYLNGNTLGLFKSNRSFYETGYFGRNPSGRVV